MALCLAVLAQHVARASEQDSEQDDGLRVYSRLKASLKFDACRSWTTIQQLEPGPSTPSERLKPRHCGSPASAGDQSRTGQVSARRPDGCLNKFKHRQACGDARFC